MGGFVTGSRRFDLWILLALALLILLASPRLAVYSKLRHPGPKVERSAEEPAPPITGAAP